MFNLGDRIKELRKQKNMSQAELANAISKRQESINRIERGKYYPSYEVLLDICRALNISISDFFAEDISTDLQRWVSAGKELTPEQRESVLQTIDRLKG